MGKLCDALLAACFKGSRSAYLALIDTALGGTLNKAITTSVTLSTTEVENSGHRFMGVLIAPAAHAACLYTALIPLNVAILAAVVLGETFTVAKRIPRTGRCRCGRHRLGHGWHDRHAAKHLFIGAGILWASYTVAMRKARLDVGASTSGLVAGLIVDHYGYSAAFLEAAVAAGVALWALLFFMPETATARTPLLAAQPVGR